MFYSIMQCGRSIHFLRDFVAKMLRPERSEGAERSVQLNFRNDLSLRDLCALILSAPIEGS